MLSISAAAAFVVLSTAEICDSPVDGGVGEPNFCVLAEAQRVETPYYSIETPPNSLVGVDLDGRRLQIQLSLRQSQIQLMVRSIPADEQSMTMQTIAKYCPNDDFSGDDPLVCDKSDEGFVSRFYVFRKGEALIVATLDSSDLAFEFLPMFEESILSIEVYGT